MACLVKAKTSVFLFFVVMLSLGLAEGQDVARKRDWPRVRPLDRTFLFSSGAPHVEAGISGVDGKELYRFACHEGDYEDEDTGAYDLLFQCKLLSAHKKEVPLDLFRPSSTWRRSRTRARFNFDGLIGKCKDHPYYGHARTFFVRGMRVELDTSEFSFFPSVKEIREQELVKPMRYSVKLRVRVTPFPSAKNALAGPVPEVCESSYELDNAGHVVETEHLFSDPARK